MCASTTAGLDSHSLDHRTTVGGIRAITRPGAAGRRCRICRRSALDARASAAEIPCICGECRAVGGKGVARVGDLLVYLGMAAVEWSVTFSKRVQRWLNRWFLGE